VKILELATFDESVEKQPAKKISKSELPYQLPSIASYPLPDPKVMRNAHIKPRIGGGMGSIRLTQAI
jgi:hypothetical protein